VIALAELERDVLVAACAVSAGIHGALAPSHLPEGAGTGVGFLGAAALLGAVAVVLARRRSTTALLGAVTVLGGLLASYALAMTSGIPLLHPQPDPIDGLALATKTVELVGLVAGVQLLRRSRPAPATFVPRPKGTTS
jgi:hypothetical protein